MFDNKRATRRTPSILARPEAQPTRAEATATPQRTTVLILEQYCHLVMKIRKIKDLQG
jgi:hypothetical protein